MRLVIDGQRLTAGRTGVGRCLEGVLADWAETGWPLDDTLLVLRDRAGLDRVPKAPGLTTRVVGERLPGLAWETLALGRLLRPGDVLLAPANLVPPTWRGPTVAIIFDTLLWSTPSAFSWRARLRFGWRYRLAARRASRIVAPSACTARDLARFHKVAPERIRVAYPAPDPSFRVLGPGSAEVRLARETLGLGNAPFFLYIGKRSRRRHVSEILAAFHRHRREFIDHHLVFVGPGGGFELPEPELTNVVDGGHVSEPILRGLLCSALALLYPSDYEGFGLPVVEAQACGCPVVTLRNSALKESAGEAAWFLRGPEPREATTPGLDLEIEAALTDLARDAGVRARLVEAGLRNVARFRPGDFADAIKQEIRAAASPGSDRG